MREVGVLEAKTRLSELLDAVEGRGEEVTITRRGKVIARLVPQAEASAVQTGHMSGPELAERFRRLRQRIDAESTAPWPSWEELKSEIHE